MTRRGLHGGRRCKGNRSHSSIAASHAAPRHFERRAKPIRIFRETRKVHLPAHHLLLGMCAQSSDDVQRKHRRACTCLVSPLSCVGVRKPPSDSGCLVYDQLSIELYCGRVTTRSHSRESSRQKSIIFRNLLVQINKRKKNKDLVWSYERRLFCVQKRCCVNDFTQTDTTFDRTDLERGKHTTYTAAFTYIFTRTI